MEAITIAYTDLQKSILDCSTLNIIGAVSLAICTIVLLKVFVYTPFKLYVLAQVLPGVNLSKLGKWAVVTGATDGIGKGYANVLAKRGLDIVLISRSQDKLTKVAQEIETEHGVKVQTIAVDFTHTDIYKKIWRGLEGLDIAILVNNVAMGLPATTFANTENILEASSNLLNANSLSMTNMCALVLPQMLEKHKGVIVNISSIAATGYVGGAQYSATKAYVSMLSECLQRTYKNSGVIIQTVAAGMVLTNMTKVAEKVKPVKHIDTAKRLAAVTVQSFVKSAVNTIGWADVCNGHFAHYITSLISKISKDDMILADL